MADKTTKKMLREYVEQAPAPMFLSGFFQSPPENFHTSEKIEIDIERDGEDVAVAITDLSVKGRQNEASVYTNKEFAPAIYKELATIPAYKLLEREPGEHPYIEPRYDEAAVRRVLRAYRKLENKIRRAVELQAAQVLQTGTVECKDAAGHTIYEIDFDAKATHFASASNTWGGGSDDPLGDIEKLAGVVYDDGKVEPNKLVFGNTAWIEFIKNDDVQKMLDNRRYNLGSIDRPQVRGEGGKFHGWISVGSFTFELWTYNGKYIDPQVGTLTPFVDNDHVIMLGDGRLDLTFGGIPRIGSPDAQVLPFMPARMSNSGRGIDIYTNAWREPDGEAITISAAARPLCIPTAIDTFGCLDVG